MALNDSNGNGNGKGASMLALYRTLLAFVAAVTLAMAGFIWAGVSETQRLVTEYGKMLAQHDFRLTRAEGDIIDTRMRVNGLESKVSNIEGRANR